MLDLFKFFFCRTPAPIKKPVPTFVYFGNTVFLGDKWYVSGDMLYVEVYITSFTPYGSFKSRQFANSMWLYEVNVCGE